MAAVNLAASGDDMVITVDGFAGFSIHVENGNGIISAADFIF